METPRPTSLRIARETCENNEDLSYAERDDHEGDTARLGVVRLSFALFAHFVVLPISLRWSFGVTPRLVVLGENCPKMDQTKPLSLGS
jgi:hypothetical protein